MTPKPCNAYLLSEIRKESDSARRSVNRIEYLLGLIRLTDDLPIMTFEESKRHTILQAYERVGHNKMAAARVLDISPKTVYSYISKINKAAGETMAKKEKEKMHEITNIE